MIFPPHYYLTLQLIGPSCCGGVVLPTQDVAALANGVMHAEGLPGFIQCHQRLCQGTAERGPQSFIEQGLELRDKGLLLRLQLGL